MSPSRRNRRLLDHDLALLKNRRGPLAGVDEAGRGPLAGPVVASAVIVRDPSFGLRIDDSKKLTPRAREAAYEEILTRCTVASAMRAPDVIDDINIYRATAEAMREAVELLEERPGFVVVDGGVPLGAGLDTVPLNGADGLSLSVACASIVAKVLRDRMMAAWHLRWPFYGFDRHKGYGTAAHLEALRAHGPCPIHRRSFAPVRAAEDIAAVP